MPIACSSGCDVTTASAMMFARALVRTMVMRSQRQGTVLAHNQQLRDDRGGDRGRGLVMNLLEPDWTDQPINIRLGEPQLAHGANEARTFGLAADQPHIAEAPRLRSEEHTSELQSHVNLVCR